MFPDFFSLFGIDFRYSCLLYTSYKFILYNKKERRAVAWENNPNRYMADPQIGANETLVIGDRYVYFALPDWKGAGVAVPIFSLRSEKSFGVGDFGDLKQMIDWAVLTRQKAVQILPINDTPMPPTPKLFSERDVYKRQIK